MTTPQQQRGYATAAAAAQAQLASAFYSSQALLAAMSVRDILGLWQQMNLRDIRSSWPAVRTGIASLIESRFGMSAAQAVSYYEQARSAAGAPGLPPQVNLPAIPWPGGPPAPPVPPALPQYSLPPIPWPQGTAPEAPPAPTVTVPPPSQALVTATLDSTGPFSLLGRIKQGQPLVQAAETTGVVMSGAASRLIENGARQVVLQAVEADPEAVAWRRITAANPCAWCAMLATRVDYKTEQSAGFLAHNHCVPAGTLVQGPATEAAYRRWHEGELVIVGTAAGEELAVTPNHPVLTSQGWVPAGLLREGHQVFTSLSAQWCAPDDPDEQQRPALIEDVWSALGVRGAVGMPVAAEDFHGDGSDGEVSVVRADRLLADEVNAALAQPRLQDILVPAAAGRLPGALPGRSDPLARYLGALGTPDGIVSSGGLGGALLGRQCGHAAQHDLGLTMALDTILAQHAFYDGPGDTERLREGQLSLAAFVAGADVAFGERHPIMSGVAASRPRYDPPSLQDETERLRVHADLGRRLAERLAGRVQLSRVINLRRVSFAGHVYNLHTAEGWYEADGLIVSNCRCTAAPIFSREDAAALHDNGLYQEWKQVTRGYSKGDALRAWRRYWDAKMKRDGLSVLPPIAA